MKLPLYQIDAFTDRPFAGNPAAVCPLPRWLDDATLAAIAAENNLSETAYVVPRSSADDDGDGDGEWSLRWFTPTAEVDLCGHATLATAFVLFARHPERTRLVFHTVQAGTLVVTRDPDGRMTMDFPARPPAPIAVTDALVRALGGVSPTVVLRAHKNLAIFDDETTVRAIRPELQTIASMEGDGLIISAPGDTVDFVSRYFAPHVGIDEDPVTGSAHCTLTPYWAERLGKTTLRAQQVSARGGALTCTLRGDRVQLSGQAVQYLEGTIEVPDPG